LQKLQFIYFIANGLVLFVMMWMMQSWTEDKGGSLGRNMASSG
jgi:hypothetical protein